MVRHSGKALQTAGVKPGAMLIQAEAHGGSNQKFLPQQYRDGVCQRVPRFRRKSAENNSPNAVTKSACAAPWAPHEVRSEASSSPNHSCCPPSAAPRASPSAATATALYALYALAGGIPWVVPTWAVGGGFAAALAIGTLAGLYPAVRAARIPFTVVLQAA
jgi:hypothetical protein